MEVDPTPAQTEYLIVRCKNFCPISMREKARRARDCTHNILLTESFHVQMASGGNTVNAEVQPDEFRGDTDVTDEGIRHITCLPMLETIAIFGGKITDKGLSYLAGKKSIKNIVLYQTLVTDVGISNLKTLPNLQLFIYYQEVVGSIKPEFGQLRLHALEQLHQLDSLKVGGNWVSAAMVTDLQDSLPHVKVVRLKKDDPLPYQPSGAK
jgi:hypothetical protein